MPPTHSRNLLASRRRFLQTAAAAASGLVLSNCARNLSNPAASSSATPSAAASSPSPGSKTLHIFTWSNYTDDKLIKSFKEKTGIDVVVDVFDTNEALLTKMQAGGGKAYSLIYPSDYMVTQMIDLGILASLDASRLQGLDGLRDKWKNPGYDRNNSHSVPYTWGTTGFVYDPKRLNGDVITGWDYLWKNKKDLNRRITLLSDVREVMGGVLKYLGYPLNATDPSQVKKAYDKLVELKPAIANFLTDGWQDQLASGDVLISMAYSSDAINLMDENPNLKYVIPKTGASLWTDTMAIPKSAPNPDAAYEWINYMLSPENTASLVERLKFASPNQAAYDRLPNDLKQNKDLFPPADVLAKCEGVAPVPQKVNDLYDRYWTQLSG